MEHGNDPLSWFASLAWLWSRNLVPICGHEQRHSSSADGRGIDQSLRAPMLLRAILGAECADSRPGISQNLSDLALPRRRPLTQVMEFACGPDDIVGARMAGSSELPEALCRKRHWSRSLRMIGFFASRGCAPGRVSGRVTAALPGGLHVLPAVGS